MKIGKERDSFLAIQRLSYIFSPAIRKTLDAFIELFGCSMIISTFDELEGQISEQNKKSCEYCQHIQDELGLLEACVQCSRENIMKAKDRRKLISYTCHAGMTKAVIPVFLGNMLIGFIQVGQFRTTNKMPAEISYSWKKEKGTQHKLKNAFYKTPLTSPERFKALLNILCSFSESAVSAKRIEMDPSNVIWELVRYMEEHPEDHLSLLEASKLIHSSKSTVSHIFKKVTGKSFRQYQIELKLNKAEEDLRTIPSITVREVASSLGYEPLYFSRLYKKYKGTNPSAEILRQDDRDPAALIYEYGSTRGI